MEANPHLGTAGRHHRHVALCIVHIESRVRDSGNKNRQVQFAFFFLFSLFLDRAGLSSPRRGTEAEVRPDPMSEVCESQLAPRLLALEASVEKLLKLLSDEISASEDRDARHLKRIQELSRLVKTLQVDTTSHGSQDAVPTLCQSCSRHLLPQGSGKSKNQKTRKTRKILKKMPLTLQVAPSQI